MQANTYELKQILTPERRYIIPTFQRDYEWTEEGQWQLLFEDLDSAAERLGQARAHAEATGSSIASAEKAVSPHFLGAIVCEQLPSPAGGLGLRAVIDGQQRLTTLQLLVRGVLDVLQEQDSPRVRQVRRLLQNPSDVVNEAHEKHKLWPRRRDRLVWPAAMADERSMGEHLYLKARSFFADAARTAATAVDGTDRTDDIVDALLDLFKLVVIDLEDNDDAQVIFEVLNGRQTPLSASDLVKNLLFLRGEMADEQSVERLYDDYWAPFDDPWWKTQVGTGHAARDRRDVVLSVWLTAASGTEASVSHLYGEVRAYLAPPARKTEQILIELHAYGQAYMAIYGAVDAGTLPPARLSLADHEVCVRAVESWVVRRMIAGANTRGYNAAFLAVLQKAQAAAREPAGDVATAVVQALNDSPNSLAWPDDAAIGQAFATTAYYGNFTQERIRLLLGSIDAQMRVENKKTEPAVFDYETLQIEHLMPRAWPEHWPLSNDTGLGEADRALAAAERHAVVHRIGNLTLVTSTFNQAVSNGAWTLKRPVGSAVCVAAERSRRWPAHVGRGHHRCQGRRSGSRGLSRLASRCSSSPWSR